MKISIDIDTSGIDAAGIARKIENDRAFGKFAASEWHRLYEPYVPRQKGLLANTVAINPWEIEHTQPYARAQYYGNFDHSKSENPDKASRKWDKAAEPTQKSLLISSLQEYVDQGKLKLD